jgi:hypothetical protein
VWFTGAVLNVVVAVLIAVGIMAVGVVMTRAMSARRIGEDEPRPAEPEDVSELDVFFVCGECGTEYQVTRLGEIQVPRHCGEPMEVVQRPRARPELN